MLTFRRGEHKPNYMVKKGFTAIVLAAGKGTRMKSPLPKVLHPVAGVPMIRRTVEALQQAGATEVRVIVGHGAKLVRQVVEPLGAICFVQKTQRGTGDAVRSAKPDDIEGPIMIVNGDHPLIEPKDFSYMVADFRNGSTDISLVTSVLKKPGSMGRIVRQGDQLKAIVEAKDASASTLKINEINVGIYVLNSETLNQYLPQLDSNNSQNEYYLTDIIALAQRDNKSVGVIKAKPYVAHGVNSQADLAKASVYAFRRKANKLMEDGVVIINPKETYIEEGVEVGEASVVYPGVYLRGQTTIGRFCVLEPNCVITNSSLGESVQILAGSYLDSTIMKSKSSAGPYARLRPGTKIGEEAKIGNFVEMKNTDFGDGAKAGHLTYLGDAEIGSGTNIGCGTITCNYAVDHKKYKTTIGKDVFVGSDTQFIAPISVGDNSVVASGSTITKDIPKGALAVARGRQIIKENYIPKVNSEKE